MAGFHKKKKKEERSSSEREGWRERDRESTGDGWWRARGDTVKRQTWWGEGGGGGYCMRAARERNVWMRGGGGPDVRGLGLTQRWRPIGPSEAAVGGGGGVPSLFNLTFRKNATSKSHIARSPPPPPPPPFRWREEDVESEGGERVHDGRLGWKKA